MNVSSGQFFVFLTCVSLGVFFGVIYTILYCIKGLVKSKVIMSLFDIIYFVLIAFLYTVITCNLKFPSFRFYMIIGVFLGLIGYIESFNFILAKFIKKIYNSIVKLCKATKKSKKTRAKNINSKDKLVDGRI